MVGWLVCISLATAEKLPRSTTRTKMAIALSLSMGFLIDAKWAWSL
jgi:hypothetical protein